MSTLLNILHIHNIDSSSRLRLAFNSIALVMPGKVKKPKNGHSACMKFEPEKLQEYIADAEKVHPAAKSILEGISTRISVVGGARTYLEQLCTDADKAENYANDLLASYPPVTHLTLADGSWSDGLTGIHLYQVGVHATDGFSMASNDDLLCLCCLILCNSWNSDPAIPGTEALSLRPSTYAVANMKYIPSTASAN